MTSENYPEYAYYLLNIVASRFLLLKRLCVMYLCFVFFCFCFFTLYRFLRSLSSQKYAERMF